MTTYRFTPLPVDTTVEHAETELTALGCIRPVGLEGMIDQLRDGICDPLDSDRHVSAWLDWAAQLRLGGMQWGDALRAAQVMYYG